jgi:phosphatidate cytidylyltransferase
MRTRVLSALVLLPVVVAALVIGNPLWAALLALVAVLGVHEQLGLARSAGLRADSWLAYLACAALALSGLAPELDLVRPIAAATVIAAFAVQLARDSARRSITDWMADIALPLGLGVLVSYGVLLRGMADGLAWTLLLLVMVWANDSLAYVAGRAVGRRPFFASVSPKKTLEGALAGTAAAVAVGLLAPAAARAVGWDPVSILGEQTAWSLALLGLAVSVVAPLGDLSQSFLKRQAGVKDSSHLIPGHGGIIDRVDSLVFAAPLGYYAALWLTGSSPF